MFTSIGTFIIKIAKTLLMNYTIKYSYEYMKHSTSNCTSVFKPKIEINPS